MASGQNAVYGQFCGLAKALDVIGDRWTLLIVRELLIRGPADTPTCAMGLPGIATNLLAERLRELEEAGVVQREEAPPPVATTLFRLTPRGAALEPVLEQIGRWGAPLLDDRSEQRRVLRPLDRDAGAASARPRAGRTAGSHRAARGR